MCMCMRIRMFQVLARVRECVHVPVHVRVRTRVYSTAACATLRHAFSQ